MASRDICKIPVVKSARPTLASSMKNTARRTLPFFSPSLSPSLSLGIFRSIGVTSPSNTTMAEQVPATPGPPDLATLAMEVQKQVDRMNECEKAFTLLRNDCSGLRKQVTTLGKALDNNTALVQALNQQTIQQSGQQSTRSSTSKPKPSLPDVDKFSGAAYTFETWLPSIEAKLRIDGDAIGSTEAQFWDKDAMEIDAIQAKKSASISTLEFAGPSSSRAQLNMVSGLSSDDDDDDDDEHSTDSESDFERKLERMAYGNRTRC
ncbi:hypothetical protein QBC45DRAFT_149499 [Copromyces sp. CBS 386.78]|nr:hypothetical protein QBC45DRAFT_149499 [Copromyces sp. CBS 386.78]